MVDGSGSSAAGLPSLSRRAEAAAVFPLPLSPFEKYVLWDERPEFPMCSFVELRFSSRLDLARLRDALAYAAHLNPLFASKVVQRNDELFWEYDPDYAPEVQTAQFDKLVEDGRVVPIDLKKEFSGRYYYHEDDTQASLLIQTHHACADGVGLRRFLIDALTSYASHGSEAPQEMGRILQQVDFELLKRRFDFSETYSGASGANISTWQRIKNAHYFHFQLPKALIGTRSDSADVDSKEPVHKHYLFPRDASEEILAKAQSAELGINDLAGALLLRTCAKWNQQNGDRNPNSRLRLLVPFDLRSRMDLRMPAANRMSFSFLGRRSRECEDLALLVSSVQAEMRQIKETGLPLDFLGALEAGASKPRLMKWALARSRRMATAVLTYTGDLSRGVRRYFPEAGSNRQIGDTALENILASPPVRENTNIGIGLCINWGQLCMSAAWNRQVFSHADTEAFLELYSQQWRDWLEAPND